MMRRDATAVPVIYLTVAVSGASVMVLEILAPRLLGPVFGTSAQIWAVVISVTLAALAAGYWLGGQLADRHPSRTLFHVLVVAAGLATLLVRGFAGPLAESFAGSGLLVGAGLTLLLLFGPAFVLLAMLTPFACRVHPGHAERTGRTVGRLYAVSTLGSVAGALLTGFALLPNWPVSRSLMATALLLGAAGVAGLLTLRRTLPMAGGILLVGVASSFGPGTTKIGKDIAVVRDEQSVYHRVQTVDTAGERFLILDGAVHTHLSLDPKEDPVQCEYARAVELVPHLHPAAERFLLIGCGGGAMLRVLAGHDRTFDVIDVDEAVIRAAREDFGADVEGATFHVGDGRRFLRAGDKWDAILLDVVSTDNMPEHLCSLEFFQEIAQHLTDDGVLFFNSIGQPKGRVFTAFGETIRQVFEYRLAITAHTDEISTNILWFASRAPMELPFDAELAYAKRIVEPPQGGLVLTDDYNPINSWNAPLGVKLRKKLHARLGTALFRPK